jgi:hypothetical protein
LQSLFSRVISHQAAPTCCTQVSPLLTPVSRAPAQSVAMLAGTDGLPTWLCIDRFHVSCRPFTPYPTAMVRGSVHSLLVKEDIGYNGTTNATFHVTMAAPHFSPFRSTAGKRDKPTGIRATTHHFHYITHSLPSVDHAYGRIDTSPKGEPYFRR